MKSKFRYSLVGVSSVLLVVCAVSPASANDASRNYYGAHATYTDASDNLCARAENDTVGRQDWAVAFIMDGSRVVAQVTDYQGNGSTCTGNLSIPEDRLYDLTVDDCVQLSTGCSGSPRVAFRS